MKDLIINMNRNENEVFPYIELNAATGECIISGSSYMQKSRLFFKPVIDWFKEYISTDKGKLVVTYNLKSLNTGTSRVLYEILEILKDFKNKGGDIYIKWHFEDRNDTHVDDIIDITSGFGIDVDVMTT